MGNVDSSAAANNAAADTSTCEAVVLATTRVGTVVSGGVHKVAADRDLGDVCAEMIRQGLDAVLVEDGDRLGLFSTADLREAVVGGRQTASPVRDSARFDFPVIGPDAGAFEALEHMARLGIQRLVVRDDETVLGLLSAVELARALADPALDIGQQIDDADSISSLVDAAARIDLTVVRLQEGAIAVERIAQLVDDLNMRLFDRAWQLIAPAEVVANTCLVVMGSEGRGEQILKTDQDNALIVRDGFAHDAIVPATERFSAVLTLFGYPPCPGQIMVVNPQWRQPVADFKTVIRQWFFDPSPEGMMRLAIFFDAAPVAGDATLLDSLRQHLDRCALGSPRILALFAAAADQFRDGSSWLTRLTGRQFEGRHGEEPVDLKKLGVFPIVHGVRALALREGVRERGTTQRLDALLARGVIDRALAHELLDALHFLVTVRLHHQLIARRAGEEPSNEIRPAQLLPLERVLLQEVMAIVKRFRVMLRQSFQLDLL